MEFQTFSAKSVDEAVTKALIELSISSDQLEYEVIDKGSSGLFGIFNTKPVVIKARKKESLEDDAVGFLKRMLAAMDMEVELDVEYDEEEKCFNIDLQGEDMGILIGKRGQTLDSLQYLTSLVVNRNSEDYIRVKLDIENYRERRKEALENLARNISYKVRKTRRAVSLEPMNPYERRVIHSALQNDKYVFTRSEGEEPYRHVVVLLKRDKK